VTSDVEGRLEPLELPDDPLGQPGRRDGTGNIEEDDRAALLDARHHA
jgi:hypothetical protein